MSLNLTQMTRTIAKFPQVYVLWAEGTSRFKVGYTADPIKKRAVAIDGMSPLPLRVVSAAPGTRSDERALHMALRPYRIKGEWFDLPEEAAWWLFAQVGVDVLRERNRLPTDDDRRLLVGYRGH